MSNARSASEYRQILTKAVCGRGRKFSQVTHSIKPSEPVYSVLGAWVINHNYKCKQVGEVVEVHGSYDLNIWYSTHGNTKTDVLKETVRYKDEVPLSYYDPNTVNSTTLVKASVTQTPNCLEASVASGGDSIAVKVEKEFLVEMTGETKVCVPVYPMEAASFDDKDCHHNFEYRAQSSKSYSFEDLDPELLVDDLEN